MKIWTLTERKETKLCTSNEIEKLKFEINKLRNEASEAYRGHRKLIRKIADILEKEINNPENIKEIIKKLRLGVWRG